MALFLRRRPVHKPARYRKPNLSLLPAGAVGVWYMTEGSGPVINEVNQREASLVGNIKWDQGVLGQHVDFTAAGGLDRIDLGQINADDPINCASTQELSIIACVRTPTAYSNQYPRILDKSDGGFAASGYCFSLESTDLMEFYVDGRRATSASVSGLRNRHVIFAVTYDRSSVRFFVDGEFLSAVSQNRAIVSDVTNAAIGNWNHSITNRAFGGDIYGILLFNRQLDDSEIAYVSDHFWAPLEEILIIPEPGISTIGLDIDDLRHPHRVDAPTLEATFPLQPDTLRHAHPLDAPDVDAQYILAVDGLRHPHRVDECAVAISEAVNLVIDELRHGHPLDQVILSPEWTLIPESLRHAHPLDESALYWRIEIAVDGLVHVHPLDQCAVEGADEIVIAIDSLRHAHPVDPVAMTYETTLAIDALRHAHPLDAPAVSALMGADTAMTGADAGWKINAGNSLTNPAGADLDWHIVEAVFDGAGSLVGVDGARVTGDAGVRELTVITIGAQSDGNPVLNGEIGELRIYNGILSQAERDAILTELQAKWL